MSHVLHGLCLFQAIFFALSGKMGLWKEYLICIVYFLIGYITLLGLFGPKLKLLLFNLKEELDPKSDESQNLSFFIIPAIFTRLME